jgi:hypothetical protein
LKFTHQALACRRYDRLKGTGAEAENAVKVFATKGAYLAGAVAVITGRISYGGWNDDEFAYEA